MKPLQLGSTSEGYLIQGNALESLASLEPESVHCIITSPPYWGLRDYGHQEQIGAEPTLPEYITNLVTVFEEARRVLRSDGTFWLNIGDGYTSGGRTWRQSDKKLNARGMSYRPNTPEGLKPKDLLGVPWRLAFALQDAGWYLRSEIIWNKPNANPESVRDRVTRSHEQLFMFSKAAKGYQFDVDAIREPTEDGRGLRRKRSVWSIPTEPFSGAHFACFPTSLVTPCLQAATKEGDTVLDPFFGSGTVGEVAHRMGRNFIGIEINPEYCSLARDRLETNAGYTLRGTQ